jgi:hypothetical protein
LRLALALKAFPVALRAAEVPDIELPDDDIAAFNLAPAQGIALLDRWQDWLAAQAGERQRWQQRVQQNASNTSASPPSSRNTTRCACPRCWRRSLRITRGARA